MVTRKDKLFSILIIVAVALTGFYIVAPAEPAAAQGTWYAEYFANRDLSGAPALIRYDERLSYDWGGGSPGSGIPADDFSARWTRDEWFESGTYRFSYRSDDGVRIWVGNVLVTDDWRDREAAWTIVDRVIPRGTHRVRVEYYEHSGSAAIQVGWERASGGAGWRGEYFANRNLSGAPSLVRYDAAIDFNWQTASPDAVLPADDFSVRWTRSLGFTAGTYRFHTTGDDGLRIDVDGRRVVEAWSGGTGSGDVTLSAGQHTLVVEYVERGGNARAHVWWNRLGNFGGWEGRYYDNREMRGGPALVRDDAEISFDWGEGAPVDWMPSDNFAVVWTRQINFAPGYYRLNARSDDGVRVWLDDGLVMDYWRAQDYQWNYADGFYLEGLHTLRVEYFEGGGGARIRFWWEPSATAPSPTGSAPALAPTATPVLAPAASGPWVGEYFNNRYLTGSSALVRSDASLGFDWGWDSPAPEVQRDSFSARWTGTFFFEAGRYTFNTYSDDGVRVYVDDKPLINSWRLMRGSRSGTLDLSAGTHSVRVEYFEHTGRANVRFWWNQIQKYDSVSSTSTSTTFVPLPQPGTCAGGPLQLDAWPIAKACTVGGWAATIFVQGHGGDCRYTYAWEKEARGGPTSGSTTFEVRSSGFNNAIVGEVLVTSAGQSVKVGLHIPHPNCR